MLRTLGGIFHNVATAWIVLAVSAALTVLGWAIADHYVERRAQEAFDFKVEEASQAIVNRMQEYEQMLRGGVGLFNASSQVSRADWKQYVETLHLDTYWPGIQGIGFARMLTPDELPAHVAAVRREGFPDFTVQPPGVRAQYSSIVFLEPFDWRNRRAFGYDMFSEPVRRAAMEIARDSGEPAVSGRVTLVQETAQDVQPGFLMYLPFYRPGEPTATVAQRRAALVGFVYSPFRMHDLLQGILGQGDPDLDFQLYDGAAASEASLLHGTDRGAETGMPRFTAVRRIQLPGRTWTVRFQSRPKFEAQMASSQPELVLFGGMLIDLLLFASIWSLAGQKTRIESRAEAIARELNRSEARYASVVDAVREVIFQTDLEGRWTFLNPAWESITGCAVDEALGRPATDFIHPDDRAHAEDMLRALFAGQKDECSCELRYLHRDGGHRWVEVSARPQLDDREQHVLGVLGTLNDVTTKREHQQQLEHMAHYDALTQLPNRVLLSDRLQVTVAQARRSGKTVAVAYLDLDGFKGVNDTFGHSAGDAVLVEVAHRLKNGVRGGDTVARLGGDEFVLLLSELGTAQECEATLSRLLARLAEPYHIQGHALALSASIGVALFPQDDVDPDTLMRHADQAMYSAKQAGRNRYHFHDPERDRRLVARRTALAEIETGLARGEFVLYYQPKVNMRDASLLGVEALIRWRHPERGLLVPCDFLPLIEDSQLEIPLGEWVLETAMRQMAAWRAGGRLVPVSVNISAGHLQSDAFLPYLRELLGRYPELPHEALEIEVLETAALEDIEQAAFVIAECHRLGVTFALDDFGTGYSSLTYFKRLPVDTLKIDQSFIRDMLVDDENLSIVEGVIGLTRAFYRRVVAEGVETPRHGLILLRLGCEVGQGYGIAEPMPAEALLDWARDFRGDPLWNSSQECDLPIEDMPLALVEADHRDWMNGLLALLKQPGDAAPAQIDLDPHACHFGHWCDGLGQKRYGHLPEFRQMLETHARVHDVAHALVDHKRAGHASAVETGLPELIAAHERLLGQLRGLLLKVRHAQPAVRSARNTVTL